MSNEHSSRRSFLKASLAAAPLVMAPGALLRAEDAKPAEPAGAPAAGGTKAEAATPLPTRSLGKTGRDVTMLNLGGMMGAHSPQYLDIAWSMGIRYFDTADCYKGGQSEKNIAAWLQKYPERRKELFLVSKDHPHGGPKDLLTMIDTRLAACGADYLDLFFIHGIGTREYGPGSLEWPKSGEFKEVAQQLKKDGKIKYIGFSCHDPAKAQYLAAAAEGGFIDVIMVAYNPFLNPGEDFDKALTACHKADIGLVAMKSMKALGDVPKRVPEFDKLGLTTQQTVLHAIWSDPRFSSICSNIENTEQMKDNTSAAHNYKTPLKTAHIDKLRELAMNSRPGMCPNCDGSCGRAAGKHELALSDIARYVNYYEKDGDMGARDMYRNLAEHLRSADGADLEAASRACKTGLDFASIVKKAEYYFA